LKLHAFVRNQWGYRLKGRRPHENTVFERVPTRFSFRIDAMPNWAALHEDDRMVAILSRDSGGEAKNELRLRTSDNLFEAMRGEMMAFVNDQMPVLRDAIIDNAFAYETLNHSNVELPCRFPPATPNLADVPTVDVKKRTQTLNPLIEQLPPVHQHERVHAALGDQRGRNNGFPECRRRRQHSGIVSSYGVCGCLLLRAERSLKDEIQRFAVVTLILEKCLYFQVREKLVDLFHATTWQRYVVGMLLRTGDDTGLIVRGQPHDLSLVEFRILESCKAEQPIAERRRKLPLGNIYLVSNHKLQNLRNITHYWRMLPTS
jgi:hypothetical protein